MKLVILDWDGVIGDTKPAIIAAMRATMNEYNIHWKWSDEAAWRLRGLSKFASHKEFFRAFIAISIGYANLDDIMQQENPEEEIQLVIDSFLTPNYEGMAESMDEIYSKIRKTDENIALEKFFPGIKEALDELSKKFKVAVFSNCARGQLDKRLRILGKDFAMALSRDDIQNQKPHPDGLLAICKSLGVAPQDAAYIGDSGWDIQAAKAAGCKSVAVTSGMALRRDLEKEKPDMIFSNLSEAAKELCK